MGDASVNKSADGEANSGVDRTLLRENLKLTVTERFRKHRQVAQFVEKLRAAGKKSRKTT